MYYELPVVEVSAISPETTLRLTGAEAFIPVSQIRITAPNAILPAVNNIPGVRMEERSPGSYRFSIRGSLLRSPFGVRNVKFYLSDFPLTDAGGNTYLNSLDISTMHSMRILKGPASGLFGANTGGVVILDPFAKNMQDSLNLSLSTSGGSFGLFQQQVGWLQQWKQAHLNIEQSFLRSDGFRDHSVMRRAFVKMSSKWQYRPDAQIKGMIFYSDLAYQTPGGLTLEQFEKNPKAARPATQTTPGAEEQQAGVMNKTFFGGLNHHKRWKNRFGHSASVFGSYTDFQNPFITNYEHRREGTFGMRTYADVESRSFEKWSGKWTVGGEWQRTFSSFENFENNKGEKDSLFVSDRLQAQQAFFFTRMQMDILQKLLLEASVSLNFFDYRFKTIYPETVFDFNKRSFNPQWMPRVSLSYVIQENISLRAVISRGYSIPTLSEIRASDNSINTNLQAERGINYELGVRVRDRNDLLNLEATFFWYQLRNAIVRQVNEAGEERFVNAGNTIQPGLEISVQSRLMQEKSSGMLRKLHINGHFNWNAFRFDEYQIGNNDYSGNPLTGTPKYTSAAQLEAGFAAGFGVYVQYYFASGITLNDAATAKATPYHILQARADWSRSFQFIVLQLFVSTDNLLDQRYSLGNDLNAFGSRFYNAAPGRSFQGGLKLLFSK